MNIRRLVTGSRSTVAIVGVSAIMIATVACSGSDDGVSQQEVNNIVATAISGVTGVASVETSLGGTGIPITSIGAPAIDAGRAVEAGSAAQSIGAVSIGNQQTGIWVDGLGSLDVDQDMATLSVGVEAREATVSAAREAAAQALQRVIDTVKNEGVAEDDIHTSSFNISPQTIWREVRDDNGTYSQPQIIGYIVSNQLSVTIRDLEKVGDVVDAAAEQAGDLVRINFIQFGVDNPSQYGETLRRMAAADALAKAQIYADALGVQVGQLLLLTETGSSAPSVYQGVESYAFASADGAARAPTPIIAGDTTLTARVQAVFAIAGQ